MSNTAGCMTHLDFDLPEVQLDESRALQRSAASLDAAAFAKRIDQLLRAKVAQGEAKAALARVQEDKAVVARVTERARALTLNTPWAPSASAIQTGRTAMLAEFEKPGNVPLSAFAKLAHKSRQQIYKDIAAKRILALSVGPRRQRVPEWQLEPAALQLTQAVLSRSGELDTWTIYRALSLPTDALEGCAPINVVQPGNVDHIADVVLNQLGLMD